MEILPQSTIQRSFGFQENLFSRSNIVLWIIACAFLFTSISNQSLWIDEGITVSYVSEPSLSKMWESLQLRLLGSSPRMPLFLVYMWSWVQIFGNSEIALRMSNIPWAMLLILSAIWIVHGRASRLVVLAFATSPFLYFYMNEARPYIGILALSTLSLAALLESLDSKPDSGTSARWICLFSIWLACSYHLLTIFVIPCMFLYAFIIIRRFDPVTRKKHIKSWLIPFFASAPLFIALAGYHLFIAIKSTSEAGQMILYVTSGIENFIFIFYELAGLLGLGPSREILRISHSIDIFVPFLPSLIFGGLAVVALIVRYFWVYLRSNFTLKYGILPVIGIAITVLMGMLIMFTSSFSFMGRHVTYIFPCIFFGIMLTLYSTNKISRSFWKNNLILILLMTSWLWSDARLKWTPDHKKEDYRAVSEFIQKNVSKDELILLAGESTTAEYYGLHQNFRLPSINLSAAPAREVFIVSSTGEKNIKRFLAGHQSAILVLSQRPYFDKDGALRKLATMYGEELAHYKGFKIYRLHN